MDFQGDSWDELPLKIRAIATRPRKKSLDMLFLCSTLYENGVCDYLFIIFHAVKLFGIFFAY
jgi:hypothetical protein